MCINKIVHGKASSNLSVVLPWAFYINTGCNVIARKHVRQSRTAHRSVHEINVCWLCFEANSFTGCNWPWVITKPVHLKHFWMKELLKLITKSFILLEIKIILNTVINSLYILHETRMKHNVFSKLFDIVNPCIF